jgi:hypothetical protein
MRKNLIRIRRAHPESAIELIQVRDGVEMAPRIIDLWEAWTLWADLSKCLVPSYVTSLGREPQTTKKPDGKSAPPPTPPAIHSSANGKARASL